MARRSLYSSYLSRESIRRAEPLIQMLSSKFFDMLQTATSEDKGKVVNISMGFRCLTTDLIMDFTFKKPLGALDSPDFDFPLTSAISESLVYGHWVAYFPALFKRLFQWLDKLPLWFVDKYVQPVALTKWCMRVSS